MISFNFININNHSIKTKLIISFTIFIAIIAFFIYLYFPALYEGQATNYSVEKAGSIAEITSFAISPALYFEDTQSLNDALTGTLQNKDIDYLIIIDSKEKVVFEYNLQFAKKQGYKIDNSNKPIENDGHLLFKLSKSINYKNKQIGKLYLGISIDKVIKDIKRIQSTVQIISFCIFILGIFIIYWLASNITSHLRKVADTMLIIAGGDLSKRLEITNHDEIGDLINSFNLMVNKLQNVYIELNEEITIRKQSEIELLKAKDEINKAFEIEKELNDLKTRFVSMVSHEYRTPLTIIQTTTYILERYFIQQNQTDFYKHLDRIRETIKDMTNLLDSILKIGRLESGKWLMNLKSLDLYEVIREIIMLEETNKSKNIHYILTKNCDKCMVDSDYNLLLHIFSNLISNAEKYSKNLSEVIVSIICMKDKIQVSIKDSGIGIPQEDIPHLFEPFFRARNSENVPGTGLGLNMVKRCLDLINGTIQVTSVENTGSEFVVILPVRTKI